MICHPLQHLELNAIDAALRRREHHGIGQIKQIMGRDPKSDCCAVFLSKSIAYHSLVIGVGIDFGSIRCLRPTANGRFNPLHFHIRTLNDANGNRGPPGLNSIDCPLCDGLLY